MNALPKMNPEVKALWLEALRGGRFQQGTEALCRQSKVDSLVRHCCLGVLCQLAIEAGVPVEVAHYGGVALPIITTFDGAEGYLPKSVMKWAGFSDQSPLLAKHHPRFEGYLACSTANDILKLTFPEIADLVETNL